MRECSGLQAGRSVAAARLARFGGELEGLAPGDPLAIDLDLNSWAMEALPFGFQVKILGLEVLF